MTAVPTDKAASTALPMARTMIAWQAFAPLPTTVRHEEDLQGALREDAALFDEAQRKARAWMDRRQEALDSGLKALSDMAACKDPAAAAAVWSGWLSGSMGRLAEDLKDAQDFAMMAASVGRHTAQAMVDSVSPPATT